MTGRVERTHVPLSEMRMGKVGERSKSSNVGFWKEVYCSFEVCFCLGN